MQLENEVLEDAENRDKIALSIAQDEFDESVSIEYLAGGNDSLVYKINTSEGPLILKIYHYAPENTEENTNFLDRYQEMTNKVSEFLEIFPYDENVSINGEEWETKFKVLPIQKVSQKDGIPYAISSFIPGKDLYDIGFDLEPYHNENEFLEIADTNGILVKVDKEKFKILHNHFGLKSFSYSERIKLDDIKDYIEKNLLGTTNISLESGNIRALWDEENKKVIFMITDIGGDIREIDYVNDYHLSYEEKAHVSDFFKGKVSNATQQP